MVQITIPEGLFDRPSLVPVVDPMEAYTKQTEAAETRVKEEGSEALSGYFDLLRNASSDYSTYTSHDARRESERLLEEDLVGSLTQANASNIFRPVSYDLSDVDVGEFTFDKTLADFRGPEGNWLYGDITDENLKKFQEELLPVMAEAVAKEQLNLSEGAERIDSYVGIPWSEALAGAYANNPEVQQIYQKYGVSPTRTDAEGSEYLYDPFSFQEIRTVDRSSDWVDTAKSLGLSLVGGALLGPLAGGLASAAPAAVQPALTGALTGAGTSALTGGDPLTGALTGGLTAGVDPFITEADLGTLGTAGAEGLSAAAIAELTGGDPLTAGLTSAGMSLGKDALEALKADDEIITPTGETTEESSVKEKEKVSVEDPVETLVETPVSADITTVDSGLTDDKYFTNTIEKIVEDIGEDAYKKLTGDEYAQQLLKHGGERAYRQVFEYSGQPRAKVDLPDEIIELAGGIGNVPDFIMETTMEDFVRPPVSRTETIVDISDLEVPEDRFEPERPVVPTPPGGGGGASSAAAPLVPTPTVTAPTPPSATITPVVQPPTLTSPGSVTNALLTNTLATLTSTTAPTTEPQPTVAPPVTPVATTAPTPEPTPVTTTEPTDILEDTTAEDTVAQLEAEVARLAEESRKAEEARAAAEAKAAAEREAIAQAEARAEAAEARLAEQQAQAEADAAAAEAARAAEAQAQADALAEAVAAGEALGEAKYGEGLGTGRGQGAGAGLGAGLGLGLLAGMGGGTGGVGTGFTPKEFEDYEFRKTYEAPELLKRLKPLQGYKAPVSLNLFRGFV